MVVPIDCASYERYFKIIGEEESVFEMKNGEESKYRSVVTERPSEGKPETVELAARMYEGTSEKSDTDADWLDTANSTPSGPYKYTNGVNVAAAAEEDFDSG